MPSITKLFGAAAVAGAIVLAGGTLAQAQKSGAKPAHKPAAPAQAAPAGQPQQGPMVVDLKSAQSDWTKVCGKDQSANKEVCYTTRDFGTQADQPPVLAVAVGIYLPFELSVPILAGGLVAHYAERAHKQRLANAAEAERPGLEAQAETASRHGLLFGAGLITGEALVGIGMAVPIVVTGKSDVLAVFGAHDGSWPGVLLLLLVLAGLGVVAAGRPKTVDID